ncbi:MAG TPA: YceI family protein [Sphingomicrobium sp.]
MNRTRIAFLVAAAAVAVPASSQVAKPGSPGAAVVTAGVYNVDPNHTQVFWTVDHLGITPLSGGFGASGGSLQIDPAKPSAAKVTVTFNIAGISTTAVPFTRHLLSPDLFDAAKHPTATFSSTSVVATGPRAKVTGNLTLRGITKPVVLDMRFYGAGTNPRSKKLGVGFSGTGTIKRSDFGLSYGLPSVGDDVKLQIVGAFDKVA